MPTREAPTHVTTIDQHGGTHEATGLPIFAFKDIRTSFADLSQQRWEDLSDDDRAWWVDVIADYHDAMVALESLDSDHRARAKVALLDGTYTDDVEQAASMIRQAIAETREGEAK